MSLNNNYPVPPQYSGSPQQGGSNNFIVLNNKSTILAYVLWLFLGNFGVHRFYLGSPVFGGVQLGLTFLGWLTMPLLGLGLIFLIPLWIWLIFDLVWIPMRTGSMNNEALQNIAGKLT